MAKQDIAGKLQKSIMLYSALGIFTVSLIISIVSLLYFYQHLKDYAQSNLISAAKIRIMAVEEYLLRGKDIALMVANRTQVRKRLEQYNNGEISLNELKKYNQSALRDSLNISPEIAGISQLDRKGNLVVACGLPIPREWWPRGDSKKGDVLTYGPISNGQESYIVLSTTITNKDSLLVGRNLLLFRTLKLQEIMDDHTGLGKTGQSILGTHVAGKINLFFHEQELTKEEDIVHSQAVNNALEKAFQQQTGIIRSSESPGRPVSIMAYGPIVSNNWGLVIKVDEEELYAPIYRQIFITWIVIIGLILVGIYGMFLLLRPLTGKILIHTDELAKKIEEKTATLQTILDSMPFGIVIIDKDRKINHLNKSTLILLGIESEDELIGVFCSRIFCPSETGKCPILELNQQINKSESNLLTKDGKSIPILKTVIRIDLDGKDVLLEAFVDITERKKAEETLQQLFCLDGLTGLANRRHFDQFMNSQWEKALGKASSLSLIMIDIDFFKGYNDTYGHLSGDDCLRKVAAALKEGIKGEESLVARYGGEEFTVILPDACLDEAKALAEKLRARVQSLGIKHAKSPIGGVVTVSLGVATIFPSSKLVPDNLIAGADQALYQAKNEGRNCIRCFNSNHD